MTDSSIQDYEYRLWAERVIREVSEAVSRDERNNKEFARAWIRWTDLVSFVNYTDLSMHKRKAVSKEISSEELRWHQTLCAGLVSLGGLLSEWSKGFDASMLDLVGFDLKRLETTLESMTDSLALWHGETCPGRMKAIEDVLPK